AEVEQLARKLLEVSPWNEEATLALAEAMAMRGEKLAGVMVLDTYLAEVGRDQGDLRVSALTLRRRITDRMAPGPQNALPDVAMVGRGPIMRRLATILGGISEGGGRVCVVRGDAGIGKTRIISEFLSFASLKGLAVHRIHCRSSDAGHSLAMLLDLISLLRSARGAIGASPETLKYLDALSRHRPDVASPTPGSPSTEGSSQLTYALVDLLEAISEESPMVLTVEDVHWADEASLSALASVASRVTASPILFLFTSRRPLDGFRAHDAEAVDEIEIPPLSDSASRELIVAITEQRGRSIDDGYREWCVRVAEGNPYFVQELANHWSETGEKHRAPPSLVAILKQRIDLITADDLLLLQTCALLENHATIENVERVLEYTGHSLLQSINNLATAGMIVSRSADGSTRSNLLTSRHDLLSTSALDRLSGVANAYLHRRAAQILEGSIGEAQDASVLWACAKHWQLAGDTEHAFRLAMSCAAHLLAAGLPSDAAEAFERTLPYCGSDGEMLNVLEGQVTAFYRASKWQQVIDTATKARTLSGALRPDKSTHDEVELMLLRAEWQYLNWDEIRSKCLQCLSSTDAPAAHRVEAGVMALMLASFLGDTGSGAQTYVTITELAEASAVPEASLLHAKVVYHTNWGNFTEAIDAAKTLIAQIRSQGDVGELFRWLCNSAVTFRAAGLFADATSSLNNALELAEQHHLHFAKSRAIPMLANLSLELGQTSEARRWLGELNACPIGAEDRLGKAEISAITARLALLDGQSQLAHRLVRNDLSHLRSDQVPHRRTYYFALLVATELASDNTAASSSIEELRSAYALSKRNLFQAFPAFVLYAGLARVGEVEAAQTILDDYVRTDRREAWPAPMQLLDSVVTTTRGTRRSRD
ncbi:MAG: AAA family ATPase, partial [Gemmatimonadaceae bacterium]